MASQQPRGASLAKACHTIFRYNPTVITRLCPSGIPIRPFGEVRNITSRRPDVTDIIFIAEAMSKEDNRYRDPLIILVVANVDLYQALLDTAISIDVFFCSPFTEIGVEKRCLFPSSVMAIGFFGEILAPICSMSLSHSR
ncbi:hypothetical protein AXF42_Ash005336 [Apostasia shenzhenica]|uniref:Uncharacterized protein n=1 Tax=Apostasia shenzhenica TaxID=1088818 RepID=A0A2I0B6Q0_9ASPA|nr:hypothetical protein AXF42_Ash005336 [Apostasia shenzhenica]